MKNFSILFLFGLFVITPAFLFPADNPLELVKTIGENKDFSFARISGAVMSKNKDIFVSDSKEHYVAKFSWDGKFIKKIGGPGQGPKDFSLPKSLHIISGKLYCKSQVEIQLLR